MKIEIDQSGKIEQTSINTTLGYSNKITKSVFISSGEKIKLQKFFRTEGKSKLFVTLTFAALLYFLLKDILNKRVDMYIDREYSGYETFIKNELVNIAKANKINLDSHYLHFTLVGRNSRAHKIAIIAHRTKRADIKVIAKEIITTIKKSRSA